MPRSVSKGALVGFFVFIYVSEKIYQNLPVILLFYNLANIIVGEITITILQNPFSERYNSYKINHTT